MYKRQPVDSWDEFLEQIETEMLAPSWLLDACSNFISTTMKAPLSSTENEQFFEKLPDKPDEPAWLTDASYDTQKQYWVEAAALKDDLDSESKVNVEEIQEFLLGQIDFFKKLGSDIQADIPRMNNVSSPKWKSKLKAALEQDKYLDRMINGEQPPPSEMSSVLSSQLNDVFTVRNLSQQLQEYTGLTGDSTDTTYNAVAFRGNLSNAPRPGNILLKIVLISMVLIATMPKCDLSNEHTRNTIIFMSLAGAMVLK